MSDLSIFEEYVNNPEKPKAAKYRSAKYRPLKQGDSITGQTDAQRQATWQANRRAVARLETEADTQNKRDLTKASLFLFILLIILFIFMVNFTSIGALVK